MASPSPSSIKVKAKIADTVKYKKIDGSLMLLENEVSWVPCGGSGKRFRCLYSDIKVQRISPETSSKVQLQIVLQDDASNNFHFSNPKGRATQMQERNVIKDLLAELIPLHRQKATKDLEEKNKIFQEKPELYQLYKELVVSNIITAQEFWENQKVNIKAEAVKQEVGIASGVLAEMKPDMHGCNELRFNLTADTIEAIFKMYPAVKQKFVSQVPHEVTEKEFWTEFFKSQHFHRDRVIKSSTKDVFGDLAKKDESECLQKNIVSFSDPLIDFSSPSPNNDEGYGRKTSEKLLLNDTLIKQFNHQSMMVLERSKKRGSCDTKDENYKQKRVREVIENEELEGKEETPQITNILHIDKFAFNSLQGKETNGHTNGNCTMNSYNSNTDFRDAVSAWTPRLSKVMSAEVAKVVLGEVSPGGKFLPNTSRINFYDSVSSDLQKEMKKNYSALSELLRHFWSCFPTKTPQLEEKVRRMSSAIEKYRDTKLSNFRCMLPLQQSYLCNHMDEMIEVALKKFATWEERRSGIRPITIS